MPPLDDNKDQKQPTFTQKSSSAELREKLQAERERKDQEKSRDKLNTILESLNKSLTETNKREKEREGKSVTEAFFRESGLSSLRRGLHVTDILATVAGAGAMTGLPIVSQLMTGLQAAFQTASDNREQRAEDRASKREMDRQKSEQEQLDYLNRQEKFVAALLSGTDVGRSLIQEKGLKEATEIAEMNFDQQEELRANIEYFQNLQRSFVAAGIRNATLSDDQQKALKESQDKLAELQREFGIVSSIQNQSMNMGMSYFNDINDTFSNISVPEVEVNLPEVEVVRPQEPEAPVVTPITVDDLEAFRQTLKQEFTETIADKFEQPWPEMEEGLEKLSPGNRADVYRLITNDFRDSLREIDKLAIEDLQKLYEERYQLETKDKEVDTKEQDDKADERQNQLIAVIKKQSENVVDSQKEVKDEVIKTADNTRMANFMTIWRHVFGSGRQGQGGFIRSLFSNVNESFIGRLTKSSFRFMTTILSSFMPLLLGVVAPLVLLFAAPWIMGKIFELVPKIGYAIDNILKTNFGPLLDDFLAELPQKIIQGIIGGQNITDEEKAQNADNWARMSWHEKIESGIARGIEHGYNFVGLESVANSAARTRIQNETEYLMRKDRENAELAAMGANLRDPYSTSAPQPQLVDNPRTNSSAEILASHNRAAANLLAAQQKYGAQPSLNNQTVTLQENHNTVINNRRSPVNHDRQLWQVMNQDRFAGVAGF